MTLQGWVSILALLAGIPQTAAAPSPATVSPQVFVGTWVGTQQWNVGTAPPGTNPDQPVSITIEYENGKLTGSLTPFMGGDDGLVFSEAHVIGDELHATATFARPSAPAVGAPSKAEPVEEEGVPRVVPTRVRRPTWKDTVTIALVLKADRLDLKGTADVRMNDVKWLAFTYDLSKKRSRY
jgi:hypothetical protein